MQFFYAFLCVKTLEKAATWHPANVQTNKILKRKIIADEYCYYICLIFSIFVFLLIFIHHVTCFLHFSLDNATLYIHCLPSRNATEPVYHIQMIILAKILVFVSTKFVSEFVSEFLGFSSSPLVKHNIFVIRKYHECYLIWAKTQKKYYIFTKIPFTTVLCRIVLDTNIIYSFASNVV